MRNRACVTMSAACVLAAFLGCTAEQGGARKPAAVETLVDRESYVLGTQAGKRFKKQGGEFNLDAYTRGVDDVLQDRTLALGDDEIKQVSKNRRERLRAEARERHEAEARANLAASNTFLEENMAKPDVTVLPSGLQYKVLQEGTGRSPAENDRVKLHFRASLHSGTELGTSYDDEEPREFVVERLFTGWKEALQLMKEGGKWKLFIPPDLAYGKRGKRGRIPPNSVLVFETELIEVIEQEAETETDTSEAQKESG